MKYTVSIKNDGPVILGSFATFVATVKANLSRTKDGKSNLMFMWTGPPSYLPQLMFGPGPCTIEIPVDMKLKPGEMTIQCTVHEVDVIGHSGELVGKSNSTIKVTGKLSLFLLITIENLNFIIILSKSLHTVIYCYCKW